MLIAQELGENRGFASAGSGGDGKLRSKLIQAAWSAVRQEPELREFYRSVYGRHPRDRAGRKAIVAVARNSPPGSTLTKCDGHSAVPGMAANRRGGYDLQVTAAVRALFDIDVEDRLSSRAQLMRAGAPCACV